MAPYAIQYISNLQDANPYGPLWYAAMRSLSGPDK